MFGEVTNRYGYIKVFLSRMHFSWNEYNVKFNIMLEYIMDNMDEFGFERALHLLTRFPIEKIYKLENEFKPNFWKNFYQCPIKSCNYEKKNHSFVYDHLSNHSFSFLIFRFSF